MPRRYEVRRKVWIACKIPDENGRYREHGETERRQLNAYEAVKQWAKESMLDVVVPRALWMEEAIQLVQKHFKLSREPSYRRALMSVTVFAFLSYEKRGRWKFLTYNKEVDNEEADKQLKEKRERQRRADIEKVRGKIFSDFNEVPMEETPTPKPEEETTIDIYTLLLDTERKKSTV